MFRKAGIPFFLNGLECGVYAVLAAVGRKNICQKRGRENRADGNEAGDGRGYAILAALRGCRMTRISGFRFRLAAAEEALCGQIAAACRSEGETEDKKSAGFCTL